MYKMLAGLFLSVLMFASIVNLQAAFAEELGVSLPAKVSSFELFWPMVAGRTMSDKLYPLKILKENVRGFFIFGGPQRADYEVFLATKRVLEAEALMNSGEDGLAIKTVAKAARHLDRAEKGLGGGEIEKESAQEMESKLSKLDNFLSFLEREGSDQVKTDLKNLHGLVSSLLSKIR